MTMPKGIAIAIFVAVSLVVVLGVVAGVSAYFTRSASPYSAVYLSSGDIYFGRLSMFPTPRLTNVWYLQRGVDEKNQPRMSVVPLRSAVWSPVDEITLNSRQIIFWASIESNSDMARMMTDPIGFQKQAEAAALQAQQQQPQGAQQQQAPAPAASPAAGFKGPQVPPPAPEKQ